LNCRDVDNELLSGGDLTRRGQDHLITCSRCRELVRVFHQPDEEATPSPAVLEKLERTLRQNLLPVRPLASLPHYFVALSAVFVVIVALGSWLLHPFGILVMRPVQSGVIFSLLAGSAALLMYSLVHQMIPGGWHRLHPRFLPMALSLLLPLVMTSQFHLQHDGRAWLHGWVCFAIGILFASVAAVLFWFLLRKGAILSPAVTGVATGMLAGLAGAGVLELHCPNLDLLHILLWHLGVVLVAAISGLTLGSIAQRTTRS